MFARLLITATLGLWLGHAGAMEALSDEQMGDINGAGLGFFLDEFGYDQGNATAQLTGIKDSQGQPITVDFERSYAKGQGSQRGSLDTPATLGTPTHPFRLRLVSDQTVPSLPAGGTALQLATPTWDDPLNDTHQYGLWSYYQGCLYGEPGCSDPDIAVNRIDTELTGLNSTHDQLYSRYQSVGFLTLKQGVDQDLVLVQQRQATVDTKSGEVHSAYTSMSGAYDAAPSSYNMALITYYKPATLGEKYECSIFGCPASVTAYNSSIDAWQARNDELFEAQKALGEAWNVEQHGFTLNQRMTDYDEFSSLCGTPTAEQPGCSGGRITRTADNRSTLTVVASTLQAGGSRVKGLDLGVESTFTLPSTAYTGSTSDATLGATTLRNDFFSIHVEGFTLNGAYLNVWGAEGGLQGEASLQMYADKLIIGGCRSCTDANRAVAKNLYFDINLGHGRLQPLSLKVQADGELQLLLPSVTWANHQEFYQQVPKSNISIGNLNVGGVDLGSQVVRGMRIDYLNLRTVNLPR